MRGGPGGPPLSKLRRSAGLPDAGAAGAGLAGALAGAAAGTRRRTRGGALRDRVGDTRLRLGHDVVPAGGRRGDGRVRSGRVLHLDLARAAADVQTRVGQLSRRIALGVVLGGGEARLDLRDEVARVRLGVRVLALALLAEEG